MATQQDMEQTKQVVTALGELLRVARYVGRDGYQFTDLGLVLVDDGMRSAVQTAIDGITEVTAELQDMSTWETFELAQHAMETLQQALGRQAGQ